MKTPMQELVEKLEFIKNNHCKTLQEAVFFDGVLAIIDGGEFLTKEKEEMKESFIAGHWNTSGLDSDEAFEEYFNETFE